MGKLVSTKESGKAHLYPIAGGYNLTLFPLELRTEFSTKKGSFYVTIFIDAFDSIRMTLIAKGSDPEMLLQACGETGYKNVMKIFGKNGKLVLKSLDDINTVFSLVETEIKEL